MGDIAIALLEFPPADIASRSPKGYDAQIRMFLSNLRQINPQHLAHIANQDLLEVSVENNLNASSRSQSPSNPDVDRSQSSNQELNFFQVLDPSVNSIAYLTVLSARLKAYAGKSSISDFIVPINCHEWNRIVFFLNKFDPVQIRYAGHDWRNLLECLYTSAIAQDNVRSIPWIHIILRVLT